MKGAVYYQFGQYQQAISALTHAIQLNPSDRNSYLCRGIANGELNMFGEAIADFNEARDAENGDYYENQKQAHKNILKADYVAELSMATSAIINYSPNDLIPHIYAGISLYNFKQGLSN